MKEVKKCRNCNYKLNGLYCNQCGQKDVELLTIKEIVRDFFDNILSLDSRLFITLKCLMTQPGYLTLEYWAGRRNRYLPPFRLYLVLSVLYFFIAPIISSGFLITTDEDIPIPSNYYGTLFFEYGSDEDEAGSIADFLGTNINKGMDISYERRITAESLIYSAIPTALFLLMPLMGVLLLKFLYRKNRYLFSHHLITTLHFHSFLFLILTFNNLLSYFFGEVLSFTPYLFLIIILIYSIIMFSKIYKNSLSITIFKTLLLNIIYGASIMVTIIGIIISKIFFMGFYSV